MTRRRAAALYALALLAGVLPLWAGVQLPLVDLPQHLHLISALHRLHDPTTLYPDWLALRGELTPYLGYYYAVDLLNWLLPLDLANKVFLSAYVIAMPLSLGLLLRSLGRPRWPSVLALPFAYGDSLSWGFINYCAALPLAFASLALFTRAIAWERRRLWAAGHAGVLVLVLLFHVQAFVFLALGLPLLLLTTRAPEDGPRGNGASWAARLRARLPALASVVPAVALFLAWVVARLGQPAEVETGAPWKAWGPMLSPQNLSYLTFEQNRGQFFSVLANTLRDGSDRWGLYAVVGVALLAALAALVLPTLREAPREGPVERFRLLGLGVLALVLYFTLPFDIRGYMYYLSTRFAHLAAALLICAVPPLALAARRWVLPLGALASFALAGPLWLGFRAFNEEAAPLLSLASALPDRPRVMGLVFDPQSRVVTHPVYLHAATVLARARGGITNFSFAGTPHSPLKWAHAPPPTFPSEWNPSQFRYDTMGSAYDVFLVAATMPPGAQGTPPEAVFGQLLQGPLTEAEHSGKFWLVRRR